jgi:TRAP-type C4-dicarboxylate transport system permease small subunit
LEKWINNIQGEQGKIGGNTLDKAIAIICDLLIIVGAIVLIIGVISRLMVQPIMGIEAQAFLQFTQTLLLFAVAFGIRQLLKK